MCCPSIRSIFITLTIIGILAILAVTLGPSAIVEPVMGIQGLLPKPHLHISFGAVPGMEQMDYSMSYRESGFDVETGHLNPLSDGTCTQCLGSPGYFNSHFVVAFKEKEGTLPACDYNETEYGTCFHLDRSESVIIVSQGPSKDTFDEFSWGVYLYDRLETGGRDLIQSPLYDPLRLENEGPVVLIVTFLPDLADVLVNSIDIPGLDSGNIFILPVPGDIIQTHRGAMNDDRLVILLKSLPKDKQRASRFYKKIVDSTYIMKLVLPDGDMRTLAKSAKTYKSRSILGSILGQTSTEATVMEPAMMDVVQSIRDSHTVISETRMIDLRIFMGVSNIQDCIANDMNCIAEDWDTTFTVSGGMVFPDPSNYKFAVVGIDHAEARRTTLSLFKVDLNQEMLQLPRINENGGVYTRWFARSCTESPDPCIEIPYEVAPNATQLFLRERVYGLRNYDNLLPPIVLMIRD